MFIYVFQIPQRIRLKVGFTIISGVQWVVLKIAWFVLGILNLNLKWSFNVSFNLLNKELRRIWEKYTQPLTQMNISALKDYLCNFESLVEFLKEVPIKWRLLLEKEAQNKT